MTPSTVRTTAQHRPTGTRDSPAAPAARPVWLWPALLTLVLAGVRISRPQLWEDELVTWSVVTRGFGQLTDVIGNADAALGPYYLLLHAWTAVFGDSAVALRFPSALAMAGAAAAVALLGQRLFGRRAALAGGLLFAGVPLVTQYGQEARPYALTVCAVAWSSWLLVRALDDGGRVRWLGYGLAVAAVGLFHLVALTTLVSHAALVVLRARHDRRIARNFALATGGALACAAPTALIGLGQAAKNVSWIPAPDVWALLGMGPQLFASATLFGLFVALAVAAWAPRPATTTLPGSRRAEPSTDQAVLFWDSPLRAAHAWGARHEATLYVTLTAALSPVLVWFLSLGDTSYFFFRYLLFTLPSWAVLAGAGVAALRSRTAAIALLAVTAALLVPEHRSVRSQYAHFWTAEDYRGAARLISQHHRTGDAAVYERGHDSWHLYDLGIPFYLPRETRLRDVFLERSAAELGALAGTECAPAARCLRGEERIWVVVHGQPADPLEGLDEDQATALRARYQLADTHRLTGLTVALLQKDGQAS